VFLVELSSAQLPMPSVLHRLKYVLLSFGQMVAVEDIFQLVFTRNFGRCHPCKARAAQKAGVFNLLNQIHHSSDYCFQKTEHGQAVVGDVKVV